MKVISNNQPSLIDKVTAEVKVGVSSITKKKPKIKVDLDGLAFLESLLEKPNEEYIPPISNEQLKLIRSDLIVNYSKEFMDARSDEILRLKLEKIVLKDHGRSFKGDEDVAKYIVRECIGTGIIEQIMANDSITDVGWDGSQLSVITNDKRYLVEGSRLGITNEYIESVISKYAAVNDRAFNSGNPSLNGMYQNVRINAIHTDNSPDGATLSIRVARPRLALNEGNFETFAPKYILELLQKAVLSKANICISGQPGTGKTELQKLLISFVASSEKIIMVEDVQETHAKELFPDKEIYSWVTSPKMDIADLVKEALRNQPGFLIVSETRGSEAYEMYKGVQAGNSIITTLHSISAKAIPRRFVNMCASGYTINSDAVEEDFYRDFNFGIHIKKVVVDGKVIRYLHEMVEFNENKTSTTVFKQKFMNGKFEIETGFLSEDFKEQMAERYLTFEFPEEVELEEEL